MPDFAVVGKWTVLPYNCPINPIHGALLNTGKILFIAGSGNNPDNVDDPKGSAVLDYEAGTFLRPTTPVDQNGNPLDLFCAGHSFLADGRLLVAGGTLRYDPFQGLPATFIFNPTSQQWTTVQMMKHGRWYPTLVTLGNGRVFTVSGKDENGKLNRLPEIYNPDTNKWSAFSNQSSAIAMYSHLFLLASGKIFYSGVQFAGNQDVQPRLLTLPTQPKQPMAEKLIPGLEDVYFGNQAASVLLPPAQNQRIMVMGGGDSRRKLPNGSPNPTYQTTTKRVNIIDFNAGNPSYKPVAYLNYARMHHNAVLLPDRTVFVCNGSTIDVDVEKSLLPAEIYNPDTNTWTPVATPNVPGRVYHAGALLLPNGQVLTFGGNPDRSVYQPKLEVYSPPYLFKGPQPVIQKAPPAITYSETFTIETLRAVDIKWINLISPMATTHAMDTSQRLVNVTIKSRVGNTITVQLTGNPNTAPPGWYMLFITNYDKVPSVASWIQVKK